MTARGRIRAVRRLGAEVICRPLPHGLVHWRYLLPGQARPILRQRSLWLGSVPGLPRPVWLVAEAWLWLTWQAWHGPAAIWRAVRRAGPSVRDEEGLGLGRQAWRVTALSLGYCLPPAEIYRYRLYRHPDRLPEYVYDHAVAAFHQSRNSATRQASESLRLLDDKERQAAELSALGVPTVPTLAVARRRSGTRLEIMVPGNGTVFCKPRHGSGSRGAAVVTADGGPVRIETLDGRRLAGPGADSWWAGQLRRDDMILQPRLRTHPDLAGLATPDDVATIRYISQRVGDVGCPDVECYCAMLELPAGRASAGQFPRYVVLEVEPATGSVGGFPRHMLSRAAAARYQRVAGQLGRKLVPGWEQLWRASHLAHGRFPGIRAIAWDWALTPDGPLLLEGNWGWGASIPQLFRGGLLADGHEAAVSYKPGSGARAHRKVTPCGG